MLRKGSNGDQILKILDSLTNDQPEAESATMTPSLEPIDFWWNPWQPSLPNLAKQKTALQI